jgi:hypothetical protein
MASKKPRESKQEPHTRDRGALRLVRQLDLNSPRLMQWRVMWLRIVSLAEQRDADLHQQLVGFPRDLPDLSRLRPPQNHRPKGVEQCCFARRRRGELPSAY